MNNNTLFNKRRKDIIYNLNNKNREPRQDTITNII